MIKLGFIAFLIFFLFAACEEKKEEVDSARGKKLPYYEGNHKENKYEYMDTKASE